MFKKSAFVSAAAAGLMMLGAPAFASEGHGPEFEDEFSVFTVDDVLSGNAVNACHNNVNVLGVQVADIANGVGLNLPILNDEPISGAEGSSDCNALANTVEHDD